MATLLVTGGAGFIGSALVRDLLRGSGDTVVNVDKLTYAGNLESLADVADDKRHHFSRTDICDAEAIRALFQRSRPDTVFHLAAESHVDRSIDDSGAFVHTNVVGTWTLLNEARRYWQGLKDDAAKAFRFVHVSTDEVFGALGPTGAFDERTPYAPNSPYSASKAGSDHLVRAWQHTYGFPCIITNCSNNYGPHQFPEKLIPLMIERGRAGKSLPVYGKGENVRDWLFVEDHVRALRVVAKRGKPGRTYVIGGGHECPNIEVVQRVCDLLDELLPDKSGPRRRLIEFVTDRPGHDFRYAIDSTTTRRELGWAPQETFETGLRKTVQWYLAHRDWVERVQSGAYRGERLGLAGVR